MRAYLSLGSNLGDRARMLERALEHLQASGHVQVVARSSIYETAPIGPADQPWFFNMAVEIMTDLSPRALLALTQSVERALGRTPGARWGPRVIDIDILLYGDLTVATAELTIPHPQLIRRRFVLQPLVEIAPALVLPDGRRAADALADVADQEIRPVGSR